MDKNICIILGNDDMSKMCIYENKNLDERQKCFCKYDIDKVVGLQCCQSPYHLYQTETDIKKTKICSLSLDA